MYVHVMATAASVLMPAVAAAAGLLLMKMTDDAADIDNTL